MRVKSAIYDCLVVLLSSVEAARLGAPCRDVIDSCADVSAMCVSGICRCRSGYYADQQICRKYFDYVKYSLVNAV